eukprot:12274-Heterococcus_DN1.PRE.4
MMTVTRTCHSPCFATAYTSYAAAALLAKACSSGSMLTASSLLATRSSTVASAVKRPAQAPTAPCNGCFN